VCEQNSLAALFEREQYFLNTEAGDEVVAALADSAAAANERLHDGTFDTLQGLQDELDIASTEYATDCSASSARKLVDAFGQGAELSDARTIATFKAWASDSTWAAAMSEGDRTTAAAARTPEDETVLTFGTGTDEEYKRDRSHTPPSFRALAVRGGPRPARQTMEVRGGELYLHGDDSGRGFTDDGRPLGPDGYEVQRTVPLNDWELRRRQRESILAPARSPVRDGGEAQRHEVYAAAKRAAAAQGYTAGEGESKDGDEAFVAELSAYETAMMSNDETDITFGSFLDDRAAATRKAQKIERHREGRQQRRAAAAAVSLAHDTKMTEEAAIETQRRDASKKRMEAREQRVARAAADLAARRIAGTEQAAAARTAQRIARGKAVHTARKTALAEYAAISEETRRQGRDERAARKAHKVQEKRLRQAIAGAREGKYVAHDATSAHDDVVASVLASTALVTKAWAAAQPALHARAVASRGHSTPSGDCHDGTRLLLVDSAASRAWLRKETNDKSWHSSGKETVVALDAQGNPLQAVGGDGLQALLRARQDPDGPPRLELLATSAYVGETLDVDLLSIPAMYDLGWKMFLDPDANECYFTSPGGSRYDMERHEGLFYLRLEIVPAHDLRAAAATIRPNLKARSSGGAAPAVTWTQQLPTTSPPKAPAPGAPTRGRRRVRDSEPTRMEAAEGTHTNPVAATGQATSPATTVQDAAAAAAADLRAAHTAEQLKEQYRRYHRYHAAWNHNTRAVDQAIKEKIITGATKPPDFHCMVCEMGDPVGARFVRNTKVSPSMPLNPYHHIEIDLWGHLDVDDRSGFRFVFGAIDRATGKLWLQPIRAKSEALSTMKRYFVMVRAQFPGIEMHLKLTSGSLSINIVSSDRGGEFTTTYGATRSSFDEFLQSVVHRLNTPKTPKSGTTRIEGVWRTIVKAARQSILHSGLKKMYWWDAMMLAADVYNMLPTAANVLGHGEAPDATLGLAYDLRGIVTLGAPAFLRIDGDKGDDAMQQVVMLGYNHDGGGHRVLCQNGTIVTSIHVRVNCDDKQFRGELEVARRDPKNAKQFFKDHFNLDGGALDLGSATGGQLVDLLATGEAAAVQPSRVVQVGDAPGHGGSRMSLNKPAPPPAPPTVTARLAANNGHGSIMGKEEADALISGARAAGQVLRWLPGFTKTGKSGERYRYYSTTKTWAQYDAMLTDTFISGISGTTRPKAVREDLRNDVARGILTFINADTPVAADIPTPANDEYDDKVLDTPTTSPPAVVEAAAQPNAAEPDSDSGDEHGADNSTSDRDEGVVPIYSLPKRDTGDGGWAGRLRQPRAAAATISFEEREILHLGLAKRPTDYTDVPVEVVMRCAAMTEASQQPFMPTPKSLEQALAAPDRELWIVAILKEIGGLKRKEVWKEVPRSEIPTGVSVVPSQLIFSVKSDGTRKCRWVARGDLMKEGEHYITGKSSMAAIETVRMQVAMAAGAGWKLYSYDHTQAFVAAPADSDELYLELPSIPAEYEGTAEWGHGSQRRRGKYVAHMKRNIYGLVQAGRVWQQHLMTWMTSTLHARLYMNDRCAFEWECTYQDDTGESVTERLIGTIHVDDVLLSVESERVRAAFMRMIKDHFEVTGCEDEDDEATKFTGIQIRRDWAKKTITLHQTDFATKLLEKHGLAGARIEPLPYKTTRKHLVPWEGEAVPEVKHFSYMSMVGDLVWLCKTRIDIAWRVSDLSRFSNRPGPEHFDAAQHLLRYLKGSPDAGLTYHGSDAVLTQSYDHHNKIILATDADFDHTGEKPCVSGVVALMNGAAIAWKVRRQTTRSSNSTEAEVKACSLGVELIRGLTDLYGEMMHHEHGVVRTMIDSTGARSLIRDGMDAKASAPIKRAQQAAEEATEQGLIWLDLVRGSVNPADILTKNLGNISEFYYKNGVVCGADPDLHESADVGAILAGGHTPLLKPKPKKKQPKSTAAR
jgi:hypothetical protein